MLIIYDCDGTLIDSEGIASEVCAEALSSIGIPYTTAQFASRYAGLPARDTWSLISRTYGVTLPDGLNQRINEQIHQRLDNGVQAVPGAADAIEAIEGVRCVASSTGLLQLRKNLGTAGLLALFGNAVYSVSQVKRGKPAPDVFLFAASQMGADPADTIVVEDTVAGVTAARRAGMRVVGFTGANHGGHDLADRLRAAGAIEIVPDMPALPKAVARLR